MPLNDVEQAAFKAATPVLEFTDTQALIDRLANKRVVLLGEATHGTQEFYSWRRYLSQILIQKHGFRFIAIEGDWPDAQALNLYASFGIGGSAERVLRTYRRWPTWMWANTEIVKLGEWMHGFNAAKSRKVGFHGLDVYSLFTSIDRVLFHLRRTNPFLARRLERYYACFGPHHHDEIAYAKSTLESSDQSCEEEVLSGLREILEHRMRAENAYEELSSFDAEQNARVIRDAERYYRAMVRPWNGADSWNIRDHHMLDTLDILLHRSGPDAKAIVWAHNTHIGDYRATDMLKHGYVNLGGLARSHYGENNVALVGFGTHHGSVVASHAWEGSTEILSVPKARAESYEHAFHFVCRSRNTNQFFLSFDESARQSALAETHGHRAIGVVYDPEHERRGNYVPTSLARRYDAFFFIDETRALEALPTAFDHQSIPETWPTGT